MILRGWEDLTLKTVCTTSTLTSKFRIPSNMILMMTFTPCVPLERKKGCVCTFKLDKDTEKTVIFKGKYQCSKPTSEASTGKWLTTPLPPGPGAYQNQHPQVFHTWFQLLDVLITLKIGGKDLVIIMKLQTGVTLPESR